MVVIIGGQYQGRHAFALSLCKKGKQAAKAKEEPTEAKKKLQTGVVEGLQNGTEKPLPLVDDAFEQVMQELTAQYGERLWQLPEQELLEATMRLTIALAKRWESAAVILTEVGSGVIALEREERVRRRIAGCVACALAGQAEACYRVFCGLGYRLDQV